MDPFDVLQNAILHLDYAPTSKEQEQAAQDALNSVRARVAELEAWQKEVASGLGYLNQPEGQSGYEVAAPRNIIHDWHEAEQFSDHYREALEEIQSNHDLSRSECAVLAAEALNEGA